MWAGVSRGRGAGAGTCGCAAGVVALGAPSTAGVASWGPSAVPVAVAAGVVVAAAAARVVASALAAFAVALVALGGGCVSGRGGGACGRDGVVAGRCGGVVIAGHGGGGIWSWAASSDAPGPAWSWGVTSRSFTTRGFGGAVPGTSGRGSWLCSTASTMATALVAVAVILGGDRVFGSGPPNSRRLFAAGAAGGAPAPVLFWTLHSRGRSLGSRRSGTAACFATSCAIRFFVGMLPGRTLVCFYRARPSSGLIQRESIQDIFFPFFFLTMMTEELHGLEDGTSIRVTSSSMIACMAGLRGVYRYFTGSAPAFNRRRCLAMCVSPGS